MKIDSTDTVSFKIWTIIILSAEIFLFSLSVFSAYFIGADVAWVVKNAGIGIAISTPLLFILGYYCSKEKQIGGK